MRDEVRVRHKNLIDGDPIKGWYFSLKPDLRLRVSTFLGSCSSPDRVMYGGEYSLKCPTVMIFLSFLFPIPMSYVNVMSCHVVREFSFVCLFSLSVSPQKGKEKNRFNLNRHKIYTITRCHLKAKNKDLFMP